MRSLRNGTNAFNGTRAMLRGPRKGGSGPGNFPGGSVRHRPFCSASITRRGVAARRLQDRGDRLLDAEIDDLVAVISEDDVDEVLADVVDVAAHRRQHYRPFLLTFDALHERLEIADRRLHRLGRLQHEGQLHLAGAEELADDFHAVEQEAVDDIERLLHLRCPSVGLLYTIA